MNHYLVVLNLSIGLYEKVTHTIIQAPDEYEAGTYALYAESHDTDNIDWDSDLQSAHDLSGEMYYSVDSAELIRKDELAILKKYLFCYTYSQHTLNSTGNYLEVRDAK